MEIRDADEACLALIFARPLKEEDTQALAHIGVGGGVSCSDAEALKEWLVGEGALEAGASV